MTFIKPVCNCPDAVNEAKKNLFSSYNSNTFDRSWKTRTNSGTGVTTDFNGIRKRGFYCKHEMSVLRIRGDIENAFPDGIPYEPPIQQLSVPKLKFNQQFDSDNLESDTMYLAPIKEVFNDV